MQIRLTNKEMVQAIIAGKEPVEGEWCVAWDDNDIHFASGRYLAYDDRGHYIDTYLGPIHYAKAVAWLPEEDT